MNDSLRSPLCVRFNAEVVACGVIFYAARRMRVALPVAPPWWTLFNVELKDIEEVARMLEALYTVRDRNRLWFHRFSPTTSPNLASNRPTPREDGGRIVERVRKLTRGECGERNGSFRARSTCTC